MKCPSHIQKTCYATDCPTCHQSFSCNLYLFYSTAANSFHLMHFTTIFTSDFWKRRGQTRVALGQVKEGLKDLSKYALHCTLLYCTALYCIALYCHTLFCPALFCTVLHYTSLSSTLLHSTTLHYSELHSTSQHRFIHSLLHCTTLYCIALRNLVVQGTTLFNTLTHRITSHHSVRHHINDII